MNSVQFGAYRALTMYVQKAFHDLQVLHHQVIGATFYDVHPMLAECYDCIGGFYDSLVENGMTLGGEFVEPTIADVLEAYPDCVQATPIYGQAAAMLARDITTTTLKMMQDAEEGLPGDMVSELQGMESKLRTMLYKQSQFLSKVNG